MNLERSLLKLRDNKRVLSLGLTNSVPQSFVNRYGLEIVKPSMAGFPDVGKSPSSPLDAGSSYPDNATAIIGMACKFPGADSLQEFWDILSSGRSMVQEIPENRFKREELRRDSNAKLRYWGNFIENVDAFDHKFFNSNSREAASTDPQQRILMEVAYQAIEDAGFFGKTLSERSSLDSPDDIGCFIGCATSDYNDNIASHQPTGYSALGSLRAFLSGRISHYFGWLGPSITYDTACSSSMVAIHSACKSLELNECSVAVAGGVNVLTNPIFYQNLAAASFLSPTGQCKPFDVSADGYCRGDGAGLVVLKKLKSAMKDGDHILGVISGSAVNQNTNEKAITVPDPYQQARLFEKCISASGLSPSDISYVEAHGTGTQLGDTAEAQSINQVLGGAGRSPLHLGSVKGNIGHTEAASGVAGLIKVLLMMRNGILPVQPHHTIPNPKIPTIMSGALKVPTSNKKWDSASYAALVNNYGAAGSNAAIVVQQAPTTTAREKDTEVDAIQNYPICISAASEKSLQSYMASLGTHLRGLLTGHENHRPRVGDLAFSLDRKLNRALPWTFSTLTSSLQDLEQTLSSPSPTHLRQSLPAAKPVVLAFGGQSGKRASLNPELYNSSALLRSHLLECDRLLRLSTGSGILPALLQDDASQDLVTYHNILFSIQYSMARTWMDAGLEVSAVTGHSFGQITALCISGSISLSDALKLVAGRASLITKHCGKELGCMIAVEAPLATVQWITETAASSSPGGNLEIACYNGPTSFVLAGSSEDVELAAQICGRGDQFATPVKHKKLDLRCGFHSRFMDPILPDLLALAQTLRYDEPTIPLETCSDGHSWAASLPRLIVEHTRSPVYFGQAVQRLCDRFGACVFVEGGMDSPVIGMARHALGQTQSQHDFLPFVSNKNQPWKPITSNVLNLWRVDQRVRLWTFLGEDKQRYSHVEVPPYSFERNSHWIDWIDNQVTTVERVSKHDAQSSYMSFSKFHDKDSQIAEFTVNPQHVRSKLLIEGHAVVGTPLAPASFYLDIAIQSAMYHVRGVFSNEVGDLVPRVEDFDIQAALGSDPNNVVHVTITKQDRHVSRWYFEVTTASSASHPITHATGHVSLNDSGSKSYWKTFEYLERAMGLQTRLKHIKETSTEAMHGSVVYSLFSRTVNYSEYYKGVKSIASNGNEVAGKVSLPHTHDAELSFGLCGPLDIDNFLQVAGMHVNCLRPVLPSMVFIANKVDGILMGPSLRNGQPGSESWSVYSKSEELSDREVINDIFVVNDKRPNELVMALTGVRFTQVSIASLAKTLRRINGIEEQSANTKTTVAEVSLPIKDNAASASIVIKVDKSSKSDTTLIRLLADTLEIPEDSVSSKTALADLGIDSLMAAEVLSEIRQEFDVDISLTEFQSLSTVRALSECLTGGSSVTPSDTPSTADTSVTPGDYTLSPEQLQKRLADHANGQTSPQPLSPVTDVTLGADRVQSSLATVVETYDKVFDQANFKGFSHDVYPMQRRLVIAYINEAFEKLGSSLDNCRPGAKLPAFKYSPSQSREVAHLHNILKDARLLKRTSEGYVRTDRSLDKTPSEQIYSELLHKFPQFKLEHELLHVTAPHLAECLSGTSDAAQLIGGSQQTRDALNNFYEHAPMFDATNPLLRSLLAGALQMQPIDQPIRILEIGAGINGTTKLFADHISQLGVNFTYDYATLSTSMAKKAQRDFSDHTNINLITLDVTAPIPTLLTNHYHFVISTNCIHATRNLTESCTNIRSLLRQDGVLAMIEVTRNLEWFDLVFGLLEDWWSFQDSRKHVIVDETRWDTVLRRSGFRHVEWSNHSSRDSEICRVIVGYASQPTIPSKTLHATNLLLQGNLDTAQRNIFAFPGGFGTAGTYAPLPKLLDHVALVGLNSPFVNDVDKYTVSLAEFARMYVSEIRRVQRHGPYSIMGYSVGGVIAYEAVRQLIEAGDEVEQLLLIDSACPLLVPPFPFSLLGFFDSIDRFSGGEAKPVEEKGSAKDMTDGHVKATLNCLAGYMPAPIPHHKAPTTVLFRAREGVDQQSKVPRPVVTDQESKVLDWVLNKRKEEEKPPVGWDRLVGDENFSVVHVDGNHFSMMTEPYVSFLSGKIRHHITDILSRSHR